MGRAGLYKLVSKGQRIFCIVVEKHACPVLFLWAIELSLITFDDKLICLTQVMYNYIYTSIKTLKIDGNC